MSATTQMEYLDLDGDGVPDAVRTVLTLRSGGDTVERVETVEFEIDDDGEPHAEVVRVLTTTHLAA